MKRLITLIVLIAMVLTIFAGCQSSGMDATQATEPSSEATEPSSEATEPSEPIDPDVLFTGIPTQGILKEAYDHLMNYVIPSKHDPLLWYYGCINDCIVIFQDGNLHAYWSISVADCVFKDSESFCIRVFKGRENCTLQEAYEKGWLTKDHIKQLEARHLELMEVWHN